MIYQQQREKAWQAFKVKSITYEEEGKEKEIGEQFMQKSGEILSFSILQQKRRTLTESPQSLLSITAAAVQIVNSE